ncbi:hypothetical protein H4Q26_001078 [Puccinia striiformis f. sp. tritici PST-130]|nr:hypothetical protein H4Q26_001078 [Puccinia striiformis f. sp. tritici PST-130]
MVDAKTDTTVHPSSPPHPHPIIAESGRGMFNALSGLGGGGQINPKTADNGAVLGEAVALGKNYRDTTDSSVSNGVYIGFLIITLIGTLLSFTLAPPSSITRTDVQSSLSNAIRDGKIELKSMFKNSYSGSYYPSLNSHSFWASNWFYTYQFNDYNLALFNIRTRSLNALLYWLSQIFGSGLFGLLLDFQRAFNRQQRACLGWIILTSVIFVVWGFGWMVQKDYERGSVTSKMDWSDSSWIMGMLADDPRDLAPLVGFYKGIQSAGAAVIFRIDSNEASYHAIFISSWSLLALGLFCLIPLLLFRIKNDLIRSPKLLIPPNHQLPPPSSTTTTTFKLEKQSV